MPAIKMHHMNKSIGLAVLVILILPFCGCKSYYQFRPTPSELAEQEAREAWAVTNTDHARKEPKLFELSVHVTDKDVLIYCNNLKNVFRKRMNVSRIAVESGATLQVLAAGAAAAYGATAAGAAVSGATTEIMAGLSGGSAVMPQLEGVFGLAQRSDAFSQGVALIEAAEARYYVSIAAANESTGDAKLTASGAQLYSSAVAAERLVEHAIASLIPTVEELQAANGIQINQIHTAPSLLFMPINAHQTVLITDNGPITGLTCQTVSPDSTTALITVPSVASSSPVSEFDVASQAVAGTAKVSFINAKGSSGTLLVKVGTQVYASVDSSQIKVGATATISITPESKATSYSFQPPGQNFLQIVGSPVAPYQTLQVKGANAGTANVVIQNSQGGSASIPITVLSQ